MEVENLKAEVGIQNAEYGIRNLNVSSTSVFCIPYSVFRLPSCDFCSLISLASSYMRYLLRRLIHAMFLLVGVSLLSFVLMELAPGDYLEEMKLDPRVSPQTIASLRARYGLDEPLPVHYVRWLRSVMTGDFGFSFAYNSAVAGLLRPRIRNTLILAVTSTTLAWLIAVPIGVWSAERRGRWGDRLCAAGVTALLAVPDIVLALGLLLLAVRTRCFPAGGMISLGYEEFSWWEKVRDIAAHAFLPILALILAALPTLVRHVRASMIEVLDAPFVRTAIAHGIPRRRILWRHALPAAANPLISLLGISGGTMLSASLLIEVIMSWPGLGPLFLEAIFARDLYLVLGSVMASTLFLVASNLAADGLIYALDPRIRRE